MVTGITEMGSTKVCMSLYNSEENCYIRPLKNGNNFDESDIRGISLYSWVEIIPSNNQGDVEYPHCEDLNISYPYFSLVREATESEQYDFFDSTSFESLEDIFGRGNLIKQNNSWGVLQGTGVRSLGTVKVKRFEVNKSVYNSKPTYRITFEDLDGNKYSNVKLVIKASFQEKDNMVEVYEKENEGDELFVRISLARVWNNGQWKEDMCALQVSCFEQFVESDEILTSTDV